MDLRGLAMSERLSMRWYSAALLAVAMVIVAFVLANWADLTTGPNDVQAEADSAASHADAIAAAKVAHAVRVATAPN